MANKDGYNFAMKFNVAEAKNRLSELIKAVEKGEAVTICRRGTPIVDLIRTTKAGCKKRKFDTLKDEIKTNDPDWWKPMSDEEVDVLLADRYGRRT
jgi:antitoxin (DNA-binding transcriptional repressor) of toxin-antitoxin stability system